MAKGLFVVRAEVPDETDRGPFDDWYTGDHLALGDQGFRRAARLALLEPQ